MSRVNGSDHRWAPVDWEGKARSTLEKRVPMIPKRKSAVALGLSSCRAS